MQISSATALSRASGEGEPSSLTRVAIRSGLESAVARLRKNSSKAGPSVPRPAARSVCSSVKAPSPSAAGTAQGKQIKSATTEEQRTVRKGMAGYSISRLSFIRCFNRGD